MITFEIGLIFHITIPTLIWCKSFFNNFFSMCTIIYFTFIPLLCKCPIICNVILIDTYYWDSIRKPTAKRSAIKLQKWRWVWFFKQSKVMFPCVRCNNGQSDIVFSRSYTRKIDPFATKKFWAWIPLRLEVFLSLKTNKNH